MIFDFLETSGSSRSARCQSFSSVRRLEAEKMPKNRNANFRIFSVRSVRYSVRFDRYCVRGSWWTALVNKLLADIAKWSPPCHALIDAGALITGKPWLTNNSSNDSLSPGRSTTALGRNTDRIERNIESIKSKIIKIFKRPKNREDGSDFDDFWTV